MEKTGEMAGSSSNNSSDFVRKLYKMLEDPTYERIVRWGENGESFVVLENEKFTKEILPKHFKHSNFASFVRQLNKYDFHKVRQNNEDNIPSPYGQNAWEFIHPEFQANKKASLDNIRRKAPAPRKVAQAAAEPYPQAQQQMDLVNSQLMATQQQLQLLSERYQELSQHNSVLLQQVVDLQKFVKNHERVMHSVMGFLHNVDASQRRNNRMAGFPNGANNITGASGDGNVDDHPATPLQHASELLGEFSAENLPNKALEQMCHEFSLRNDYSTPPNDPGGPSIPPPHSEPPSANMAYPVENLDLDNMVYPVGATNGINPINSEHINNIPYALPPSGIMAPDSLPPEMMPQGESPSLSAPKKSMGDSIWHDRKPTILLVEDDKVCLRIGSKFLQAFECRVETASDGLEAVNRMNLNAARFDLILMDIIMPNLDGVSATVCIRDIRNDIPIIAMTSNIRTDDISMYFRYGMNDVLPKPFTKEGMIKTLEKHLSHLRKRGPQGPHFSSLPQMPHAGGFVAPNQAHPPLGLNMGQLSATQSIKEEAASSGKSPQTATSWHSPNQLQGGSPVVTAPSGAYMQPMRDNTPYAMTPTHPHPQSAFPPPLGGPQRPPHRRVMSDMSGAGPSDDHPEKRQRLYPPPTGAFNQ